MPFVPNGAESKALFREPARGVAMGDIVIADFNDAATVDPFRACHDTRYGRDLVAVASARESFRVSAVADGTGLKHLEALR